MKKNILSNILTFVVIFLALNLIIGYFTKPGGQNSDVKTGEVAIVAPKEFSLGSTVKVDIKNETEQNVTLKNECPEEPLDVFAFVNNQWVQKKSTTTLSCEGTQDTVIKAHDKVTISYVSWNHALFGELGRYKLEAHIIGPETAALSTTSTQNVVAPTTTNLTSTTISSAEFEIKPQGLLGYLWGTVFFQPLYNVLIFLVSTVPGNDLGFAIILLTIIIRTILLIPSQNALKSQRKMQEIQPKLAKIKETHKNNQEAIARETMNIWKEHKVNPLGSCLPLLIQFPVLIALFYVVQSGLNPDNAYLLYGKLQNFAYANIHVNFLNILDLTKVNFFVLPLIVGGLQFLQMKMAMLKSSGNKTKSSDAIKPAKKEAKNEMEIANSTMLYIMPVMIAVFTASVPAGVGLYWAVSTLYGIGQQFVVNRQSDQQKVQVKVLPNPEQANKK